MWVYSVQPSENRSSWEKSDKPLRSSSIFRQPIASEASQRVSVEGLSSKYVCSLHTLDDHHLILIFLGDLYSFSFFLGFSSALWGEKIDSCDEMIQPLRSGQFDSPHSCILIFRSGFGTR